MVVPSASHRLYSWFIWLFHRLTEILSKVPPSTTRTFVFQVYSSIISCCRSKTLLRYLVEWRISSLTSQHDIHMRCTSRSGRLDLLAWQEPYQDHSARMMCVRSDKFWGDGPMSKYLDMTNQPLTITSGCQNSWRSPYRFSDSHQNTTTSRLSQNTSNNKWSSTIN